MGLAIDTVVGHVVNAGATVTAVTVASGDSLTVRSFGPGAYARLERVIRAGASSGIVQVRSPMFHDNVRGIRFTSAEDPTVLLLPPEVGQPLTSQDTLIAEMTGGTAETDLAALVVYYSNVLGTSARLHSWGDISGNVKSIKPLEVDCTASATIGTWVDTVATETENLLHANTDYAVLGYVTDVNCAVVGIKGQETGNLRICGPGTTVTDDTSDYFVKWSNRENTPHIPVINAANIGSVYASVVDSNASTAVKVQLILAELMQNLAS